MELIEIRVEDFCCFKEFVLPLRDQGLIWVTGENRDTKAADNNGSGKTTLFKALTWGLYGHTIDGERGDKVIRQGQKRAKVEVVLADEKGEWIVRRERRKGMPKIQLIQPDGEPFEAAKDVLQDRVIEMVGLDFPAFKNTVLYGQNDSARFAHPRTKDTERKEMLHRILRTGVLKQCHEWALEERRELKRKAVGIEADISNTISKQDMLDVDGLQEDVDGYERERMKTVKWHRVEAKKHKDAAEAALAEAEDGGEALPDRTRIEHAVEESHKAIKQVEKWSKVVSDLADAIGEKTEQRIEACGRLARIDAAISGIKSTLGELEGQDKCPTCTSPLDKGQAKKHLGALKVILGEHQKTRMPIQKDVSDIDAEVEKIRGKKQELDKRLGGERAIRNRLRDAEKELTDLEAAEIRRDTVAESARERAKVSLERARDAVLRMREAKSTPNPYGERLEAAKSEVKKLKKQRKVLKTDKKKTSTELAHTEFWVRGFSNQGLPSYILDAVMPYVGTRANHYLETLADGDITMDFRTQREMKSSKGEYRDEIDISWEIEGLDDSYPPSGGQLKKMEIATDLALMDMVATREGSSLDLLALDEVLDGLDAEGRNRVLMLLGDLRARRGTVFVISHESEMSEIFEKSITVIKEDGIARLAS